MEENKLDYLNDNYYDSIQQQIEDYNNKEEGAEEEVVKEKKERKKREKKQAPETGIYIPNGTIVETASKYMSLQLPEDLYALVAERAKEKEMSVAGTVSQILEDAVNEGLLPCGKLPKGYRITYDKNVIRLLVRVGFKESTYEGMQELASSLNLRLPEYVRQVLQKEFNVSGN